MAPTFKKKDYMKKYKANLSPATKQKYSKNQMRKIALLRVEGSRPGAPPEKVQALERRREQERLRKQRQRERERQREQERRLRGKKWWTVSDPSAPASNVTMAAHHHSSPVLATASSSSSSSLAMAPPSPSVASSPPPPPTTTTLAPLTATNLLAANLGKSLVGGRVARAFEEGMFFGTIQEYLPVGSLETADSEKVDIDMWCVEYDDGDEEDYDFDNIQAMLAVYETELHNDSRAIRDKLQGTSPLPPEPFLL